MGCESSHAVVCVLFAVLFTLRSTGGQELTSHAAVPYPPYFLYQQQVAAPPSTGYIAILPQGAARDAQGFADFSQGSFVQGYGDGVVGLNLKTEIVASASMSINGGTTVIGTIGFLQQPYRYPSTLVYVLGAVELGATNANLQNLVVSVNENPDISDACANIGAVYNAGGFFLPDGGIITRGESSNSAGVVNFNTETSKLLGGIKSLANQRSVAISNGGQVLACGVIVNV